MPAADALPPAASLSSVLVVGSGLLGTSVGLALTAAGVEVWLVDTHAPSLATAVARGAGQSWDHHRTVDLLVAAVPPRATAGELQRYQALDVAATYTHVASVQSQVQREVEALGADVTSIVGGHPMAGRETSGPGAAEADLFRGRPWCICPGLGASTEAIDHVRALVQVVGAVPTRLTPERHDEWVALVSHLPQIAASALSAQLTDSEALGLTGPGLVDTTRIAASDPDLWTDVLTANSEHLVPLVSALARDLGQLADVLVAPPSIQRDAAVRAFLLAGAAGRALVPVKRGAEGAAFSAVRIDLADQPGELARLLVAAADIGVNVEDVRVDHLPGRPRGVVHLSVEPARRTALALGLAAAGWAVQQAADCPMG